MAEKIPCQYCSRQILAATSRSTGGVCRPCQQAGAVGLLQALDDFTDCTPRQRLERLLGPLIRLRGRGVSSGIDDGSAFSRTILQAESILASTSLEQLGLSFEVGSPYEGLGEEYSWLEAAIEIDSVRLLRTLLTKSSQEGEPYSPEEALLAAVSLGRVELVETLLAFGADPLATNDLGANAAVVAETNGCPELRDLLLAATPELLPNSAVEFQAADREVEVAGHAGADYFLKIMFADHPDWNLVAVAAPVQQAAAAYAQLFKSSSWLRNAHRQSTAIPGDATGENAVYALQLEAQPWTLLLRPGSDLKRVSKEAAALSQELSTQTVAFGHQEAGGNGLLSEYQPGRAVNTVRGKSNWRKFFRDRELFVPMHLFDRLGPWQWLILEGVEPTQIQRLDVLTRKG